MMEKYPNKKTGFKTSIYENIEAWETSRRRFIKTVTLSGLLAQFSYLQSCNSDHSKIEVPANDHFSEAHTRILMDVLEILFPDDGNGPNINDLNSLGHIFWVLNDPTEDPSQNDYLKNGVGWTEETALETYGLTFLDLKGEEKENLIAIMAKEKWGKDWLSMLLTYIFESLIIDEIYQVNKNGIGWKWLEHQPGEPRPNASTHYTRILEKIQ